MDKGQLLGFGYQSLLVVFREPGRKSVVFTQPGFAELVRDGRKLESVRLGYEGRTVIPFDGEVASLITEEHCVLM